MRASRSFAFFLARRVNSPIAMTRVSLALFLAFATAGCGDLASPSPRGDIDASTTDSDASDAGTDLGGAAFSEAGAGIDAEATPGSFMGFAGFPADLSYNASFDTGEARDGYSQDPNTRLSCFDGLDNDASMVADCADPACQSLGSCCVGRGDCCVELSSSPLPTSLDVSGCSGTEVGACLTAAMTTFSSFGSPGPFLDRGALAPGGDASGDGGLLLGDALDLRTHRVALEADFVDAEECGPTCLESVALGVVPDGPVGRIVHPLVALLSSPSLAQVRLIIGDDVVKSFPSTLASSRWSLSLDPEGRVRVGNDQPGFVAFEAPFTPIANARLLIYGRSRNPSATGVGGARIGHVTVHTSLCDMPAAWGARQALPLLEGGNPASTTLSSGLSAPSMARDGLVTFAAFARAGSILLGELSPDGAELSPLGTPSYVVPDMAISWQAGGFDDPALLRPSSRPPEVYFTATGTDGVERIGMASLNDASEFAVAPLPALDPADYGELLDVSEPSVVEHSSGVTLLLAHVRDARGTHLEAFYRGAPSEAFARILDGNLAAATESGSEQADADDVSEPSLVLFDHAWHLYVARRQGARYSIGLLASDELVSWRWIDADAFGGSGVAGAFDRLGARSPAVEGNGNSVDLLYLGLDGASSRLGRVERTSNGGTVTP